MKFPILLLLLIGCGWASAQNIYSDRGGVVYLKPLGETTTADFKRGSYAGPHLLGDSVTILLNNFEKAYVYYKMSSGAYKVEEKVVLKRNIYTKVHEFDKFITESYKHNLITEKEAKARVMKILSVGIKLMSYDTRQLEKEVKKIDLPTDFEKYLSTLQFN